MAAYAALVSVMQIIHQIDNHPFPPISLDQQQVESLTEKVNSLQEFLEGYDSPFGYSDEADPLEMRIADAAYVAEDVIESYIVDNIKFVAKTTHYDDDNGGDDDDNAPADDDNGGDAAAAAADDDDDDDDGNGDAAAADDDDDDHGAAAVDDDDEVDEVSCITFYEDVQKVIEEMDLLVREVTEMAGEKAAVQRSIVTRDDAGFGSISSERKSVMVGFDDMLLELLDRLTGGQSSRQIIPIVGMGGAGKTTLARNAFENQLIKERFDICVWATISQNYDIQETLAQVLSQVTGNSVDKSELELGEKLYKIFCGWKYLIVLDDMWSLEVWDEIKFFFPENNNGSRILVTTRLSNMATDLTDSNSLLHVKTLDEISSWRLFSQTIFGEDSFPCELEEIGKKIVKNCNGHPLTIVVIGGLLAKSQRTLEHWEEIEEDLISRVNTEKDEYCLRILKMSYNHLPMCLKPCFLYMGVFAEDSEIYVPQLKKLWVSEGFVKPGNNKSLETIAREYLKELVDRNLVLVSDLGLRGNVNRCKLHDLLRDLCLKEAEKQRFYFDLRSRDSPRGMFSQRRVVIRKGSSSGEAFDVLESISHVRSILWDQYAEQVLSLPDFRLLRILNVGPEYRIEDVFQHVNLRYIAARISNSDCRIPSSINLLWNLQTFTFSAPNFPIAPTEIWKMHQLRHVRSINIGTEWYLPNPPNDSAVIMENLQTLKEVRNVNLNEEVVKRIPNIKKLGVVYDRERIEAANSLSNLRYLSKLESFFCWARAGGDEFLHKITFPKSLKKLTLVGYSSCLEWEDILEKIGSLPLLQKLRLSDSVSRTRKWETTEGHFPSLKVLILSGCLENWIVSESSHFPRLQELHLYGLEQLEEIPSEIGEIATLKSIDLQYCSESVVLSAKKIVEEQEELQGEQPDLHVTVQLGYDEANALQYLASPNFHIS